MGASGSMGIRPESEADHDAVRRTVTSAFGSDAEALLVDRIRASPECVPEMALVAVVDDEVVGHVMISDAVLQHVSGERRISMLSPLAVRPERQREGIGRALVRAALAAADERREPLVVLKGARCTTAGLASNPPPAMASPSRYRTGPLPRRPR